MAWLKRILWAYLFLALFGFGSYRLGQLTPSPDPNDFAGLEIAHRGAALHFPENTLAAIDGADALGAHSVEVDVMLSEDGVPVVIHDPTVDRTTDGEGLVREHTLDELRALRVRTPAGDGFGVATVPTLEAVIERVIALDMKLEIELKTEVVRTYELSLAIVALFDRFSLHDRAFVSSFDPRFLYYVRQADPRIVTALAVMEHPPYGAITEFLVHREAFADFLGVGIIEPEQAMASDAFVDHWLSTGRLVNVWTVNAERDKAQFRQRGVTITTDCPGESC